MKPGIFNFISVIGMALILTGCNSMDMDKYVDELYDRMSQDERIAQLRSCYMDQLFDDQGNLDTAKCRELIPHGVGHFSQYASQNQVGPDVLRDRVAAVQKWLMENTPSGIPALFHEEALSGANTSGSTIYPQQIGQACSFNPELAELKTLQTGVALRKIGCVLALSPMVDVCRVPSFNRLEESYGEDGYLSAVLGTAFVRGIQQGDLRKGVGACTKHYLGYGGGGDAEEKEMMEEILLPHETAIRLAGSRVIMPGYHAVHGTNCVENEFILKDILHDYLGFEGMVVSDYNAVDQIPQCESVMQKAAAAINAGNDVDFPHGANYIHLDRAMEEGLVSSDTFERAVKNVLRHKYASGLFDRNPYLYSEGHIVLDTPEERKTAYDLASQSVVLLENNGILPLKGPAKVFLTGPNASSMWAMCGDYSYPSMAYFWQKRTEGLDKAHIVSLLEGMRGRKPDGFEIAYSRGCDWTEVIETQYSQIGDQRAWEYSLLHRKVDSGETADWDAALGMAQDSDVIVAAMGENVMLCGENRDRQGLRLPGRQEEYVEALLSTGKPVVLVMFGGRAQIISGLAERCAAVIQAWYPGEEGGNAVADILYGNIAPSVKLSVSYPKEEIYESVCYNRSAEKDPRIQWPFGYGLSYTTFEYSDLETDAEVRTSDDGIILSFDVTNTGKVTADEIAQIYVSPGEDGQSIRPVQLQGFARVALEPGQTRRVCVKLYLEQFGYYSNEGSRQWNIAPGTYEVKVGASSADIRLSSMVTLKGKHVQKPLRDHYFSEVTVR